MGSEEMSVKTLIFVGQRLLTTGSEHGCKGCKCGQMKGSRICDLTGG